MRAGLFSQPAQVSSPGFASATFDNDRVQRMCREEDRECQGKKAARISPLSGRRTVWMLPTLSNTPHRLDGVKPIDEPFYTRADGRSYVCASGHHGAPVAISRFDWFIATA